MGNKHAEVKAPEPALWESVWSLCLSQPHVVVITVLAALVLFYLFQNLAEPQNSQTRASEVASARYKSLEIEGLNVSLEDADAVRSFIKSLRAGIEVLVGQGQDPTLVAIFLNDSNELTYRKVVADGEPQTAVDEKYATEKIISARLVDDIKDRCPKLLVDFDSKLIALMSSNREEPLPQLQKLAEGFGSLVLAAGSTELPLSGLLAEKRETQGSPVKATLETIAYVAGGTYTAITSLGGLIPSAEVHPSHPAGAPAAPLAPSDK